MLFINITTIDPPETLRREDGFHSSPYSGTIHLASFLPDFENFPFGVIKEALIKNIRTIIPQGGELNRKGFNAQTFSNALIVTMKKPYTEATVSIGKAIIERQLDYKVADGLLDLSPTLKTVNDLVNEGIPPHSQEMTKRLGVIFNNACADVIVSAGLPFLGKDRKGMVISHGFCSVTPPLRKANAFINCLQLSTYLEHGVGYFSKEDLERLLVGN